METKEKKKHRLLGIIIATVGLIFTILAFFSLIRGWLGIALFGFTIVGIMIVIFCAVVEKSKLDTTPFSTSS